MVKIWRRSFDTPPPLLEEHDSRHPSHDVRYKNIEPKELPSGEVLNL
jgi:2,3-bisphosphoglycerate-dependent phosphoglycerate mutase